MSLQEKVKTQRIQLGLTQKQLAEKAAITQATISRIESGNLVQLQSNSLKRLATALNVTTDYLIDSSSELSNEDIIKNDPGAKKLINIYKKLNRQLQENILMQSVFLYEQQKKKREETENPAPITPHPKKA
ncbi:MAG: hypothetical protein A2509_12290 [Candidatus Edwardsbacteria bacterium RIFOXYD12_FULL_50_11]|uniref:HTH cro/C1-type domain-containing protein n=1 Tax=Candidatus Edwardsbacteria bacterium GWF2_54_11 TaxID=1817851 RepID=A0A1F5R1T7_9BACT|nr:MAG: hypothetical protein A2502_02575 [Candidatus Edwardsbacteria bacterium RifOxyC12_full_54_24]OGF08462.1 MAG: hypothetical protein A2024_07085 [Candidatus Edwardsbacteria bacterium GWF2_54_11]OGF09138.1 MAG: hypothetical protein A2273_11030 [Candidatus Edwardsbacteria bacterium RifOxyA12_full_54_48]OGF12338.1 MAG: hypothetical protein A3K15_00565 [Candidatus Edwardsbacteria bacterium GWE2_54_12]OGF15707.1 MAG: hypothetical protein A2509_12290 [Candidatus Edwardsbacteria bacterium RIFOXYD1